MKNFALIGVGGYIAPRHMQAIKDTGNKLVAAMDVHDSVGVMDNYFPEAEFDTSLDLFERRLRNIKDLGTNLDYFTVCSPNYLHDAHVRFGLKMGAHVICEKPIVLDPWDVDALEKAERETGKNIYTILQLRLHPAAIALKEKIDAAPPGQRFRVDLRYIAARGNWYHASWKGDEQKSGGIATNIGIHFFDLLLWLFGDVKGSRIITETRLALTGELELEKADINWLLSIDAKNLSEAARNKGLRNQRELRINEELIDFSEGFTRLHVKSYEEILTGGGIRVADTRKVIELVHGMRKK